MKLFKRTAKDARPAAQGKAPRTGPRLSALLPGLLAVATGLLLAAGLLWFGVLASAQQQHRQQLAQAWGGGQAATLQLALEQLASATQRAAHNPQLLEALQSQDRERIRTAERNLGYWAGVVDAHLNPHGQATQDMNRDAPMNFAALDLLRRVENGQIPAVEAYRIGERWLVYSAAPVRLSDDQPLQGTLLLAFDLKHLLASLPPLPAAVGQLQLFQQFAGGTPQLLAQRGQAEGSGLRFDSGNPNWALGFTPGPALDASALSPALLGLAALLTLVGAVLGLLLVHGGLQRRLHADVQQLGQMIGELSAGKSVKAFSLSLPALDGLARTLARLPRHPPECAGGANARAPSPAAATAPHEPADLVDPLFQDADILDIDILDEDQDLLGLEQPPQ
ncbi:hypothetical protein I0E98_05935 [Pseudomonas lalucatii]|nr:hypothetical protein [Pseudomonas lalucatii]